MLPLPQPYLVNLPHREFVAPRNEHYGVVNPKSLGGVAISDTTEEMCITYGFNPTTGLMERVVVPCDELP